MDVDKRVAPLHQLRDVNLELVDFGALLSDHDSRTRGMNVDLGLVGHPLDFDSRDSGVVKPLLDKIAKLQILMQQLRVVVARGPSPGPALDNGETKTPPMDFLTRRNNL